jgi:hypothetical protein
MSAQVFLWTELFFRFSGTVTRVVCLEVGCPESPAFSQPVFFLQGRQTGEPAPDVGRDRGGVRPGPGGVRGGGAEGGRGKLTLKHTLEQQPRQCTLAEVKPFGLNSRGKLYLIGRLFSDSKMCFAEDREWSDQA